MSTVYGRHSLQTPDPTHVPERIRLAMAQPTMDHRGPEFSDLTQEIFQGIKAVSQTSSNVVIFPSSGAGALEAAFVNTLSPDDRVLMYETGYYATKWRNIAANLGLDVDLIPGDWRSGVDLSKIEAKLVEDSRHDIRAIAIVHNETSSGVTSDVGAIRKLMDSIGHPALLMVNTMSSFASMEYKHDDWDVDVTISTLQKGLMLPPGLAINIIGKKAHEASKFSRFPKYYWNWEPMLQANKQGFFLYTPTTNLLYGLKEALHMIREEGLENIFIRHERHAEATRRAVRAWGLELICNKPEDYSSTVTAVFMPDGFDADRFREMILDNFNMALGDGLGRHTGKAFRINHLGHLNDLMLAGTLSGLEMGLSRMAVPFRRGGVSAALDYMAANPMQTDHSPAVEGLPRLTCRAG